VRRSKENQNKQHVGEFLQNSQKAYPSIASFPRAECQVKRIMWGRHSCLPDSQKWLPDALVRQRPPLRHRLRPAGSPLIEENPENRQKRPKSPENPEVGATGSASALSDRLLRPKESTDAIPASSDRSDRSS
jgi:hypothetical protein